ncbi:MAG: Ldh family oxidoreductase [Planctomycetota bacterium]
MVKNSDKIVLPEKALRTFCQEAFRKAGLVPADAEIAAEILVSADLRGIDSHGFIRLVPYVDSLLNGGANPHADIRAVAEGPAYARVDGDNGLGLVVGARAMERAIHLAQASGVGVVTVFNSSHFGAAAGYTMMASQQDMIGFALSNTTPVMSLWDGKGSTLGNNPIAFSAPSGGDMPIVLDMAVSTVAGGKVRLAAKEGKTIPTDWITDSDGLATDDPHVFDGGGGALLPHGTKGYGLGIMVEVLAGVLSGARIMNEIPLWFADTSKPVGLGHFFIAMKIDAFYPLDEFKQRIDELINKVHSAPKAKGVDRLYLPGEMEYLKEQERKRAGLPLPSAVYQDLLTLGNRLGIAGSLLRP